MAHDNEKKHLAGKADVAITITTSLSIMKMVLRAFHHGIDGLREEYCPECLMNTINQLQGLVNHVEGGSRIQHSLDEIIKRLSPEEMAALKAGELVAVSDNIFEQPASGAKKEEPQELDLSKWNAPSTGTEQ